LASPNNREATLLYEEYRQTIVFVVFGCRDEKEFTRLDTLKSCSRCDWIVLSVFRPRFCDWGFKSKQPSLANQPSLSTAPNCTDATFTRQTL
jgi:hypothetical protein